MKFFFDDDKTFLEGKKEEIINGLIYFLIFIIISLIF